MPLQNASNENHRGILYMVAASTGFILNDTFVKLASADIPIPQIIVLRSVIALPLVVLFCWRQGLLRNLLTVRDRFLWLRTFGEIGGTATFLTALARMEIANITAVAQLTPLAVTGAAALFLGEKVGIRRWTAIVIGFLAVLLVIRPGMEGFSGWSVLALVTVAFVVLRDLSSRAMHHSVHPLTVTVISLATLIPLGLAMSPFEPWRVVPLRAWAYCAASAIALSIAYVLVVQAMRHGEISVVAPFRYIILLWALVIQIVVFAVWPDSLTVLGSAILVATGLYTVYRERKVKGPGAPLSAAPATVPPPT
jgi:drug/metabolite transporter (DMT)-like permease